MNGFAFSADSSLMKLGGNNFDPNKEKHHGPILNASDSVELSYANVKAAVEQIVGPERRKARRKDEGGRMK